MESGVLGLLLLEEGGLEDLGPVVAGGHRTDVLLVGHPLLLEVRVSEHVEVRLPV